jgi:chromosomal replication initiation ATPase DnaA
LEISFVKTTVWDELLEQVAERLSQQVFDTWFRPLRFVSTDDDARLVRVSATEQSFDWITKYYSGIIDESFSSLGR